MSLSVSQVTEFTEEKARTYFEGIRWPQGAKCVHCGSKNVTRLENAPRAGLFQCNECREQFSVTTNNVMHGSHLPLRLWAIAFHLIAASKKGVSALQLSRMLGVTYKTAWHLAHRIRHAMNADPKTPTLDGIVEVDETYVGGKAKGGKRGRGAGHKVPVVALIERGGNMATRVVERCGANQLRGAIKDNVKRTATINTDEWRGYARVGQDYKHLVVCHGRKEYVAGKNHETHVNSCESWFALLKRGVHGSFHHVSKTHLHRYCAEFAHRWNYRKVEDGDRAEAAIRQAEGKVLIYKHLA